MQLLGHVQGFTTVLIDLNGSLSILQQKWSEIFGSKMSTVENKLPSINQWLDYVGTYVYILMQDV